MPTNMRQNKTFILLTLLCAVVGNLGLGSLVSADDRNFVIQTGCGSLSIPSLTAITPLPENTYDVYVRLGKRGQTGNVSGYARINAATSSCKSLGTIEASGDEWRLLGTMSDPSGAEQTILQLSSPLFSTLSDANRPSLMLVTHEKPLCRPAIECMVRVGEQTGYVRPSGTLLNENSLHVVRVTDPQHDSVRKVRYYVDNRLVYTAPTLQPFDMRYVSYAGQHLARVVEYRSGQQVVFEEMAPEKFLDTFPNFVFKLVRANPGVVRFLLWVGSIAIGFALVGSVIRFFERRRQWQYDHGFRQHTSAAALTESDKRRMQAYETVRKVVRMATIAVSMLGVAALLVVVMNAYIVQIYSVDGRSMESTLHDGQRIAVSKMPRALANLNRLEYVPKRGEVVVAHMVFGVTATDRSYDETGTIVKRVLGLPGERIVVEDGVLTVFNKEHPEGFQPDAGSSWEKTMHKDTAAGRLELTLGPTELFLSGDNRPESIDSRFNGPIEARQIIGPLLFQRAF